MYCLAIVTCIVTCVGAVMVNVNKGENISLFVKTSQPKTFCLRKVQKNETQEISCYCSPEEQKLGCKPSNSSRFSHHVGDENFSITFPDADTSDEGCYVVEVIDNKNKMIQHYYSVSLTEQLPSSISPEPPSIHPFTTPALSTKAGETFGTNGPITTVRTERNHNVTWGIIGGLIPLILVIVVTCIICCKKKNIAEDDAEDPGKGTPLNSDTNGAGEPATDESFEILVQSDHSVNKNNEPVHGA